jgi:hypothetical protein
MDERREYGEPHARALAWPGRGAGARHAREWSTEIHAGARLPFAVLFFGCLDVKFKILTDRYKDLN